uniref:Uncharacterized protein n=1 Tax=Rhodnius prolixus TaxID=13249 RepID=T1HKV5_RHOPR
MNNRCTFLRKTVATHLLTSWGKWMSDIRNNNTEEDNEAWKIYYKRNCFILLPKDAPLALDITALCAIFTICGPFLLSCHTEIDKASNQVITFLFEKYNIRTVVKGDDCEEILENPTVSLLSVVKCFPNVCCELYSMGICGPLVPANVLGKTFKTKKRAILCPLFPMVASEILFKPDGTNIIPQLLWIACNVNFVSNKKMKPKKNMQKIWNRLKQDLRNRLINEEVRVKLCVKWDILDERYKVNNNIMNSRNYCLRKLGSLFTDEAAWKKFKSEIDDFHIYVKMLAIIVFLLN